VKAQPVDAEDIINPSGRALTGRALEAVLLVLTSLTVLLGLAPKYLLSSALPWRSDLTGHAVVVWADQQNLWAWLPGSWSDVMFSGFPINQLYPWLPSYLASLSSHVVGLGVSMRLVVVVPLVLMPVAAWYAGRRGDLPAPVPLLLAVGTLPFLYDTKCDACGGTAISTVMGEYAFAWGLMFALFAMGAVARLVRTGEGVAVASLFVAATAWSHPLPTLWLAVGSLAVVVLGRPWRERVRGVAVLWAGVAATLLGLLWWLPFLLRRGWMPLLGLPNVDATASLLLPASLGWEVLLLVGAVAGMAKAVRERWPLAMALAVQTAAALVALLAIPAGGQLYNARVLPFWYLGRWMLAMVGLAWAISWVSARLGVRIGSWLPRTAPAVALLVALSVIGTTWSWWGTPAGAASDASSADGLLSASPFADRIPSILGGAPESGEQAQLAQLHDLIRRVAVEDGCGRLLWDLGDVNDPASMPLSDPFVLWQSAQWTDGCITSADGLLIDSSATAPATVMTASLVSQTYPRGLGRIPSLGYNLSEGLPRLGVLGVRYYVTTGGPPAADAATAGLKNVAQAGPWTVWEVDTSPIAVPLSTLPFRVASDVSDGEWETLGKAYFTTSTYYKIPLARTGEPAWPTVGGGSANVVEAPGTTVTDVVATSDEISFTVANTGSPVIVRVSDYPGWSVTGAAVTHQATPNFLVLTPTESRVTVSRTRTAVDWVALLLGMSGVVALAAPRVRRRYDGPQG
jgi:hypothetical protein